MKPIIELLYDVNQDIYHASSLYTGLQNLSARGMVYLRFRRPTTAEMDCVADPLTVCLKIRHEDNREGSLIALDLHDQSDVFAPKALRQCDVYFKRSYHEPDLAYFPEELTRKIEPFGLNFASRTPRSSFQMLWRVGLGILLQGKSGVHRLRRHLVLPNPVEFEQGPDAAVEPTIVFQTRVWEPHETAPGECDRLNENRVAVIRALRKAFGERFRGGLVPTALARARYPREVSVFPTRRRAYIAMSKQNLIGVYTHGLHGSTAFKLPEYLAASQCIVAETPRNGLPAPLCAGEHFLPFEDAEECVAACRRLLTDRELAQRMRRSNHDYYLSEVEPTAHMAKILERGTRARDDAATSVAQKISQSDLTVHSSSRMRV